MNTSEIPLTHCDQKIKMLSLRTRQLIFLAGIGFCLTAWASPGAALAVGMALALVIENPFQRIGSRAAKALLQASVVLLGFGMNLGAVLVAGERGVLFAVGTIAATLLLGAVLGRAMRINRKISTLISAGTAICGGSAIAAVGSVIGAADAEITAAMGTVFLLNAAALYTFPLVGHALGLSQTQFGTWAGIAIHDISSVVGAASHYGLSALQTATAVKLSRALWIVPISIACAAAFRSAQPRAMAASQFGFTAKPEGTGGKLHVPWFIGLFLLASIARSLIPSIANAATDLAHLAEIGLTVTLFLIGASLSAKTVRAVGWKPLVQGLSLWLFISAASLWIIVHTIR